MASFDIGIPDAGQFNFGRVFDIAEKGTVLGNVKMGTYRSWFLKSRVLFLTVANLRNCAKVKLDFETS